MSYKIILSNHVNPEMLSENGLVSANLGGKSMTELLQEYTSVVAGPDGSIYSVRSYGEERADGTWIGWLEFEPEDLEEPTLATDQETSQPNRTALEYWATGLEPVYFEGAFERTHVK